jgi:DNA-binding IclR family transcriptional regulator
MSSVTLSPASYRIMNIEKALAIVEMLSEIDNENKTLAYIEERIGVTRNKAFRIVCTLVSLGIVEKDEIRGTYHLGMGAFEFAQKLLRPASVINQVHPIIEGLARKHQEAVYLTVLQDRDVLFVDMADCEQNVRTVPFIGKRYPILSTAAGKVMAAMGSSTEQISKWLNLRRKKPSENSLFEVETELAKIRQNGVAVDEDSLGDGVISVSVPFRDYGGKVLGAITLLGPSFRLLTDRLENEIVPSLLEGAEMLSMKFGYARA